MSNAVKHQFHYFKFVVKEVLDEKRSLTIIVTPLNYMSDPDLYISTSNPRPNYQSSEVICRYFGFDICFLPKTIVKQDQVIYVAVYSEDEFCDYKIRIEWTKEGDMIEFSRESFLYMDGLASDGEFDQQYFKLFIPNDPQIVHFTVSVRRVPSLTLPQLRECPEPPGLTELLFYCWGRKQDGGRGIPFNAYWHRPTTKACVLRNPSNL